jgi:hypothetical protein
MVVADSAKELWLSGKPPSTTGCFCSQEIRQRTCEESLTVFGLMAPDPTGGANNESHAR